MVFDPLSPVFLISIIVGLLVWIYRLGYQVGYLREKLRQLQSTSPTS